jgi:hypothetical protein
MREHIQKGQISTERSVAFWLVWFEGHFLKLAQYLMPHARVVSPRPETLDEEAGKRLWDWLEEQVKHM